ncbi:MAG TPA: DJ-1/PfpI family protein [Spirochaetota bacterium]|nr:DJ-1/PfpI family protein [Spirochaetota bacterium]
MKEVLCVVFDQFETLDLFGPVEIFGRMTDSFRCVFYSRNGGIVESSHGVPVVTKPFSDAPSSGYVLLIPGGAGTRALVGDAAFVDELARLARGAEYVLTVCTGSILFSKTGLLDGRRATSNKRVFMWTGKESPKVNWIKKARWVRDGNIYTSSGVSAGMDMALAFVADVIGYEAAKRNGDEIEYFWSEDPDHDPFADLY